MDHPKYHVNWIQFRTCPACNHVHKEQFTYAFFTSEAAMAHAIEILNDVNATLLSIEQ